MAPVKPRAKRAICRVSGVSMVCTSASIAPTTAPEAREGYVRRAVEVAVIGRNQKMLEAAKAAAENEEDSELDDDLA